MREIRPALLLCGLAVACSSSTPPAAPPAAPGRRPAGAAAEPAGSAIVSLSAAGLENDTFGAQYSAHR